MVKKSPILFHYFAKSFPSEDKILPYDGASVPAQEHPTLFLRENTLLPVDNHPFKKCQVRLRDRYKVHPLARQQRLPGRDRVQQKAARELPEALAGGKVF